MKYIYPTIIFLLISLPSILVMIEIVQSSPINKTLIPSLFFHLTIPVQYILGFLYAKKHHFDNVYADIHRSRRHNESVYQHMPQNFSIVLIIVVLTVITTIISTIMFAFGHIPKGFTLLINNYDSTLLVINAIVHWLYSWGILITNLFIFIYVFSKHLNDINALQSKAENLLWNSIGQSKIVDLGREIVGIKFTLNQSIDNLQEFYTSTTILGALAIGAVIETKVIDVFIVANIVVYCILQIVFLYFIYQISERRSDITKILKSPALLYRYLNNVQCMNHVEAFRQSHLAVNEIERLKVSAYNQENGDKDVENNYYELLSISYKNNASIDWIIINSLLSEQWVDFSLLGVCFSDTDVIKKSTGLISALIVFSSFISSLTLE